MDMTAEEDAAVAAAENAASPRSVPHELPRAPDGRPVSDALQIKGLMQEGMTRRDCGRLADQPAAIFLVPVEVVEKLRLGDHTPRQQRALEPRKV